MNEKPTPRSRKSISELVAASHSSELKKALSAFNLTTLGIGAIIGAGIFVITGSAAAKHAGPGIVLSFLLSGVACAFAAFCYAEFASMIHVSGSTYTYAYATMGEFVAWLIGWDLILEYLFASATVAVGWSGYLVSFVNRTLGTDAIPAYLTSSPLAYNHGQWIQTGAMVNLPAVFIILFITIILVLGVKESASFNNVIVVLKLAIILVLIGAGVFFVKPENWTPFIPENTGTFGEYGISGILRGAGVIFFAYIGFDSVSTAAQEAKNPKRDMPIGIIASLLICTVLYVAVSLVMTGIVKYDKLNVADPMAVAVDAAGPGLAWLAPFVKIGAIAGLGSVILVLMYGQTRIFFAMAKDGFLPDAFASSHPRFKTPVVATLVTGAATAVLAGFLPIGVLGELVSIGTLFAFVIVCVGILILRKTEPNLDRPVRTPWVPFVPIMGAGMALLQMVALPLDTWIRLFAWMGIGLVLYGLYGHRRARARDRITGS